MNIDEKLLYEKRWYALHTKCRHEKQVDLRLKGIALESYLPIRTVVRKWKDRKKEVDFPLFPGYTFVKMTLFDKQKVLMTPSVVKLVGMANPMPIPDEDIEAIKQFIASKISFDPYPYLISGTAVIVKRGPLKGVKGILNSKKNKHRFIVNLELINNSVATEIDAEDIMPL